MSLLPGLTALALVTAAAEHFFLQQSGDIWQVSSDLGILGDEGTLRGAGGYTHLSAAKAAGAEAVRTWGFDQLNDTIEEAEALGLKYSAGIWLTHDEEAYENCSGDIREDPYWQKELERILDGVRAFKNSSAILWWTVGNEIEFATNVVLGSECTWRILNQIILEIKAEDPMHPVGYVSAGAHEGKLKLIKEFCTDLDFLGVNSYGEESLKVGDDMRRAGLYLPYALMEFGPTGHWSANVTAWGSYIEESSTEKVPRYAATCELCFTDPQCIAAFAFVWGWKWEKTGTWYGLFNEWTAVSENISSSVCPVCESEVLSALQKCWTGQDKSTKAPSIHSVAVDGKQLEQAAFTVDQSEVTLVVNATQQDGNPLTGIWVVTEEIVSEAVGGVHEDTNPLLEDLFPDSPEKKSGVGLSVILNTSTLKISGNYRLYVFVREDPAFCSAGNAECPNHEAYASMAFRICHDALPGEQCYSQVRYAMEKDLQANPDRYPGATTSSSFSEVQMVMAQLQLGDCPHPCGTPIWCHSTEPGEACYDYIQWLLKNNNTENGPEALHGKKSIKGAQRAIHEFMPGICPRPCEGVGLQCEPNCEDTPDETGIEETSRGMGQQFPLVTLVLLPAMLRVLHG